jgi:hypothetical protein
LAAPTLDPALSTATAKVAAATNLLVEEQIVAAPSGTAILATVSATSIVAQSDAAEALKEAAQAVAIGDTSKLEATAAAYTGERLTEAVTQAADEVGSVVVPDSADATPPTVLIQLSSTGPVAGPVTVTFTFSEEVIGFTSSDVSLTGGSISAFKQSSSDARIYTALVTPNLDTELRTAIGVAEESYRDTAGNLGLSSDPLHFVIDTLSPSAPAIRLASEDDSGVNARDGITNNTSGLTITGTKEAGS